MLRFTHLAEQILQKLDDEGLAKSREVEQFWQKFVDERDYSWLRIVNIPTILAHGDTYLHLAAGHGQIDEFEMLIKENSNADPINDVGETPFLIACIEGRRNIVARLLQNSEELKIDLNQRDICGFTPFSNAAMRGHSEVAKMIMDNSLQLKIDLNIKDSEHGLTAFHYACMAVGHSKVAEMMINNSSKLGIDLTSLDNDDSSAFHLACYYGNIDIIAMMLKNSSMLKIDWNGKNIGGYTGFQLICDKGHSRRIAEIIINYSECLKIDLNSKTSTNGMTAFHLACMGGDSDISQFNCTRIVDMMMEQSECYKIDLTTKDELGRNGYQIAEFYKNIKVMNLIKTKMPSLVVYSDLSNSRGGWNKQGGGAKVPELINKEGVIFWKTLREYILHST